jgi:muramoyltetrapeptide carboxypeptidase
MNNLITSISQFSWDLLLKKIKPRKIGSRAKIYLVAPSSYPIYPSMNLSLGIDYLRKQGFEIVLGETVRYAMRRWYLSAPDEVRARDLVEGFRREDVDVIWFVRGGAGAMRILELIDYEIIEKNPKPVIGFSDATAIQTAIYSRTGLVTIHGGMIAVTPKVGDEIGLRRYRENIDLVIKLLRGETLEYRSPPDGPFIKTINPGKTSGELVGGNLILFTLIQSTPYRVDTENKILFLEDIREDAWRIDNYLTTLGLSKDLSRAIGIIMGEFPEPEISSPTPSLEEVIIDRIKRYSNRPAILNFPCCHGGDEHGHFVYPLPIGGRVSLDADLGEVRIEEPVVE